MKFSRGMVRAWFDVDVYDDIDRDVDELNLIPGVTAFMVMLVFLLLIHSVRNIKVSIL